VLDGAAVIEGRQLRTHFGVAGLGWWDSPYYAAPAALAAAGTLNQGVHLQAVLAAGCVGLFASCG